VQIRVVTIGQGVGTSSLNAAISGPTAAPLKAPGIQGLIAPGEGMSRVPSARNKAKSMREALQDYF
jgi:hypothetical protein